MDKTTYIARVEKALSPEEPFSRPLDKPVEQVAEGVFRIPTSVFGICRFEKFVQVDFPYALYSEAWEDIECLGKAYETAKVRLIGGPIYHVGNTEETLRDMPLLMDYAIHELACAPARRFMTFYEMAVAQGKPVPAPDPFGPIYLKAFECGCPEKPDETEFCFTTMLMTQQIHDPKA